MTRGGSPPRGPDAKRHRSELPLSRLRQGLDRTVAQPCEDWELIVIAQPGARDSIPRCWIDRRISADGLEAELGACGNPGPHLPLARQMGAIIGSEDCRTPLELGVRTGGAPVRA